MQKLTPFYEVSRVVPCRAVVHVAAIECRHLASQFRTSGGFVASDLNSEPYDSVKLDQVPGGYRLLSDPKVLASIDFEQDIEQLFECGRSVDLDLTASTGDFFLNLIILFKTEDTEKVRSSVIGT